MVREKVHAVLGDVWASRVIAFGQFWELVIKGFMTNRCPVRATALAYTTLLALIPMLAVVASVMTTALKSQGRAPIDNAVETIVSQILPKLAVDETNRVSSETPAPVGPGIETSPTSSTNRVTFSADAKRLAAEELEKNKKQIVDVINDSLQKIQSGSLGVTGMIGLIVVAILLFSTIESTFNDIWGVRQGRSWVARIVQYWATVTLGPLIPFAVLSLNIGSRLQVDDLVQQLWFNRFITKDLLPIIILSFGFSFFYQLMPNTRVRWGAAFVGGFSAGCLWHLNSYMSVFFIQKSSTFANIYGPLAVIPIFLFGLYISWLILLFGAQVAYAFQNRVAYLQEKEAQQINFLGRQYMALRIMTLLGRRFRDPDGKPPSVIEIAQVLRVSTRLVKDILNAVIEHELVTETAGEEVGHTLARPLENISCHDILMAMRTHRGDVTSSADDYAKEVVDDLFKRVMDAEKSVSATTSLGDLVEKLAPKSAPIDQNTPDRLPSAQPA